MQNLANHDHSPEAIEQTNKIILKELAKAGIEPVEIPKVRGEVPTTYEGVVRGFRFSRAWYYWCVSGMVPLKVATELFENPNGVDDIRACGHCGCPHPKDQSTKIDEATGKKIISDEEWFRCIPLLGENLPKTFIKQSESKTHTLWVPSYHIDTQEGLNFFVHTINKYWLSGKFEKTPEPVDGKYDLFGEIM